VARACARTESRTRSDTRMVEVVRRNRASGLGVVTARLEQRSAAPGMSAARSYSPCARAREEWQGEAATRGGRLAALLQRAAGFLRRQTFLAVMAHCCGLPDQPAALFADSLVPRRAKTCKKGFLPIVYIKLPTSQEARSTSSKQKIEEAVQRSQLFESLSHRAGNVDSALFITVRIRFFTDRSWPKVLLVRWIRRLLR
jgi:hypothetical protein